MRGTNCAAQPPTRGWRRPSKTGGEGPARGVPLESPPLRRQQGSCRVFFSFLPTPADNNFSAFQES